MRWDLPLSTLETHPCCCVHRQFVLFNCYLVLHYSGVHLIPVANIHYRSEANSHLHNKVLVLSHVC